MDEIVKDFVDTVTEQFGYSKFGGKLAEATFLALVTWGLKAFFDFVNCDLDEERKCCSNDRPCVPCLCTRQCTFFFEPNTLEGTSRIASLYPLQCYIETSMVSLRSQTLSRIFSKLALCLCLVFIPWMRC